MRTTVSVINLRWSNNACYVLLQNRLNEREYDWVNTLELPQGKIRESLFDSAACEVKEEANLTLQKLLIGQKLFYNTCNYNGLSHCTEPFAVVYSKGHLALHYLAVSNGDVCSSAEANNQQWVQVDELSGLLCSQRVCPLNRPALEKLYLLRSSLNKLSLSEASIQSGKHVVAFDIGGIFIEWNDELLFSNIADLFGCSALQVYDLFIIEKQRHKLHSGQISHVDLYSSCLERFNQKSPSFAEYCSCWKQSLNIMRDNIDIVNRIISEFPDCMFVITSNIDALSESRLQEYVSSNAFDFWFTSWRMNCSKPDSKFFSNVREICNSNQIMLIDDMARNIDCAAEFGWKTYLHTANQTFNYGKIVETIQGWVNSDA